MSDTLIGLRLLLADGAVDAPFVQRQWSRLWSALDWLEARVTPEGFWPGVFSVMDIALLCPMLFADKRGMFEAARWPGIASMIAHWSTRESVLATPVNTLAAPAIAPS